MIYFLEIYSKSSPYDTQVPKVPALLPTVSPSSASHLDTTVLLYPVTPQCSEVSEHTGLPLELGKRQFFVSYWAGVSCK